MGLVYQDEKGEKRHPVMGSYGIGLGRLMGAVVEIFSDEKGIIWPEEIAPYTYHIIALGGGDVLAQALKLAEELEEKGKSVFLDDRDVNAGVKFTDADLIGIPHQLIVSEKILEKGDVVEHKERAGGTSKEVMISKLI
jgi:prolyl-tRNA synthetase